MKLDVETHGCASLFLSTNFTNEHKYSPQPPIGIKCIYSINMKPLQVGCAKLKKNFCQDFNKPLLLNHVFSNR
jgi:hypothetical protein